MQSWAPWQNEWRPPQDVESPDIMFSWTKLSIIAWSDFICDDINLPLMAGGGDSVAGVILLSFPKTGAGCRFKALVSMFQQAGGKHKLVKGQNILKLFIYCYGKWSLDVVVWDQQILVISQIVYLGWTLQLWPLKHPWESRSLQFAWFVHWEWWHSSIRFTHTPTNIWPLYQENCSKNLIQTATGNKLQNTKPYLIFLCMVRTIMKETEPITGTFYTQGPILTCQNSKIMGIKLHWTCCSRAFGTSWSVSINVQKDLKGCWKAFRGNCR